MSDQTPLAGKTALLTGATSGIGPWTALGLIRRGARVIAAARDPARAAALNRFLEEQMPGASAELLLADLSKLSDVRRLAADVRERAPRLDVLVNNAGMFAPQRALTADGFERVLAVNYLAPFLLTRELLPVLRAAGRARVVNVGSTASDRARIDLDNLNGERGWSLRGAYGQSKLALMIATFELARRVAGEGIAANVVHPGLVATRIGDVGGMVGLVWRAIKPFAMTPEDGARTTVHVASAGSLDGVSGRYFKRETFATPNRLATDTALAARLWEATERMLGPDPG